MENIMMSNNTESDFEVKICDFGLARILIPGEKIIDSKGTLGYAPPEVLLGMPLDHSVDLWCLGIILYALLSGCLPFQGETEKDIKKATIRETL